MKFRLPTITNSSSLDLEKSRTLLPQNPRIRYMGFVALWATSTLFLSPSSSTQVLDPSPLAHAKIAVGEDTLAPRIGRYASILGEVRSKASNDPIVGSSVYLIGTKLGAIVDSSGSFRINNIPQGTYEVRAGAVGFRAVSEIVYIHPNEEISLTFHLAQSTIEFPDVRIIGMAEEAFLKIPGSGLIVESNTITQANPISTSEILRKVPGVWIREEEGFGIRPNIGVRGLFPTRSTKVLLLEDGVPFSLAPYGDPASYYHPPIHRFSRVEVLKGSGQILFGPQTIGGVINYLTPQPPALPAGTGNLVIGNRDYLFGQLTYGGRWGNMGFLADYSRKQGKLARENSSTVIQDMNAKFMLNVTPQSTITLKLNAYDEKSNVTYAGLTDIEFQENPFQNRFADDWFYFKRFGSHLIHDQEFARGNLLLTTNLYGYFIKRDWWRQGNNGGTNSTAPLNEPGTRTILNPFRNDGRNREYIVWGVEPRLRIGHQLLGLRNESDIGIRAHFEYQDRKQIEGNSPTARSGVFLENNIRKTRAYSAFVQNRFFVEHDWTISAGLRYENFSYDRMNNLNGASGREQLRAFIPGVGVTNNSIANVTLFAGIHRGYAPPRIEDVISNDNGTSTDLDAEKSWNYELGVRMKLPDWLNLDLTIFRMKFENQIIPSTLAGGGGTTVTNAGRTLHEGLELKAMFTVGARSRDIMSVPLGSEHRLTLDIAYTFLPTAKFEGLRYSAVSPSTSVTGNRVTYAPKHLLNVGVGFSLSYGFDIRFEANYVGDQFSDDLNTVNPTPNGRQGIIPQQVVWNLTANYAIPPLGSTIFLAVKNVFDRVYIVDRSRGILPGSPRLVQSGIRVAF